MVKSTWGGRLFRGAYLALMLLFLYAPIAVLIVFSFNENKSMGSWGGFSLDWYKALFMDQRIIQALWVTLSVAVLSAIAATLVGTFAAIGIHAMKKRRRHVVENISQFPMVNPDLVTGVSLMLLFVFMSRALTSLGLGGFRLGYGTMLIAHITFNLPYVIFSVLPKLRQSSNMLYEAALDLGCTPWQALKRVVIPDIMPGIVSGFVLAFTLSLDDFVVSYFTQSGVQNLSIYVYSIARRGINPKINALSTLMFVAVVGLLLFVNLKSIREEREARIQSKKTAPQGRSISKPKGDG